MSSRFIKSGLELFDEDFADANKPKKKKVETTIAKRKKSKCPKTEVQKSIKPLFERQVRNALKDCKRRTRDDVEDNIRALKRVDQKIGASEHFQKVAEIQEQELKKKVLKPKKQETSVFTDEDFKKFGELWLSLSQ